MNRKQLQHAGLIAFFALMTVYLGANAYVMVTAVRSSPGWAVSQKGERAQVVYVLEQSAAAGVLEVGDEIVAFNRRPVTNARELISLTGVEPGTSYALGIRRGDAVREVSLRTEALPRVDAVRNWAMFFIIGPLFLVFAGIIYVFKPDDKQAVLLVLLFASFMPGTPFIMHDVLPLAVRSVLVLGEIGSLLMFPFFFHFFLVFPERSPLVRRFPSLERWLYLPCALVVIPSTILAFALLNFAPAIARDRNEMLKTLMTITMVIVAGYILAGLASLLVNYRQANRQSRRRLRVVVAGSLAGLLPLFMVSAYGALVGFAETNETLLRWLFGAAVAALLLFPLSFAYAIMRHHVIPLRLIIRRGVRYLLVSRGSKIIELLTVGLTLALLLRIVVARYGTTDALTLALVSSVTAIILWNLSSALHHRFIAPEIDRRFFRRVYDPQRLITELGEELRGTTDLQRMQSIVGARLQEALQTENVAVLLRDAETDEYRSDLAARYSEDGRTMVESPLNAVLTANSYVVERLRRTYAPLEVDFTGEDSWAGKLHAAAEAGSETDARSEVDALLVMKSALLIPVATRQMLLGIISLGARLGDLPFGSEDRQMLAAVSLQLAYAVENAQLVHRQVAEEQLRREVEMATEVQQRLFPAHAPQVVGAELAGVCFPARGVGGDYYDFLRLDEGRIGVAVADVAGKGISAALLMSTVQASLRSYAPIAASAEAEVTDLVHSMNGLLYASTSTSSYASFFYAQYEEQTRRLTYTNAGHNPPLLVRGGGEVESIRSGEWRAPRRNSLEGAATSVAAVLDTEETATEERVSWLTTGGPVIGIFERCDYEQESLQLQAGDVILLYTDGVTEALNNRGEEFSEDRLRDEVTTCTKLSAQEITDCLVGKLHAWCGETPQHDDLTLVVMKVQ